MPALSPEDVLLNLRAPDKAALLRHLATHAAARTGRDSALLLRLRARDAVAAIRASTDPAEIAHILA